MDLLDLILKLAVGFGSLVGVAALISAIIDVLKTLGVVADGTAGRWSAGLNLVAFAVLVYFAIFQPQIATQVLDGYAGQIAMILLFVLGYLVQIFTASGVHDQLKAMRIPLLGASSTKK
jgi:hypothetical protein